MSERPDLSLPPPIAVQIWSVHELAKVDLEGVLRRIAEIGFVGIELVSLYGMEPSRFSELMDELELEVASSHTWGPVGMDAAKLDACLDEAQAIGNQILIDGGTDEEFESRETVLALADRLNKAARQTAERGVTLGYHNHNLEFSSRFDGETAYEILMDALDPSIRAQVDIYWVANGGADPAEVLRGLGDRILSLHVKDGPIHPDDAPTTPIGEGKIDVPASIAAAPNVDWHIVEFEECDIDIYEAMRRSYDYLVGGGMSAGRSHA